MIAHQGPESKVLKYCAICMAFPGRHMPSIGLFLNSGAFETYATDRPHVILCANGQAAHPKCLRCPVQRLHRLGHTGKCPVDQMLRTA